MSQSLLLLTWNFTGVMYISLFWLKSIYFPCFGGMKNVRKIRSYDEFLFMSTSYFIFPRPIPGRNCSDSFIKCIRAQGRTRDTAYKTLEGREGKISIRQCIEFLGYHMACLIQLYYWFHRYCTPYYTWILLKTLFLANIWINCIIHIIVDWVIA
jgi:hypothetical protein